MMHINYLCQSRRVGHSYKNIAAYFNLKCLIIIIFNHTLVSNTHSVLQGHKNIIPPFNKYISQSTPPSKNQNILPFSTTIYATLPESTPPSQNIPPFSTTICHSPRIYPPSQNKPPFQQLYATLTESTPPSQNTPPFQQLYATLLESTPPSQNNYMCGPPRICTSLPEYTPFFNNYMRPSQDLLLPPRI